MELGLTIGVWTAMREIVNFEVGKLFPVAGAIPHREVKGSAVMGGKHEKKNIEVQQM